MSTFNNNDDDDVVGIVVVVVMVVLLGAKWCLHYDTCTPYTCMAYMYHSVNTD